MTIKTSHLRNCLVLVAFSFASIVTAHASTLTYTFSQGGWTDGGTLTGSFSGAPEANGTIELGDLTSFTANFELTANNIPNTFTFNTPTAFSFNPGSADILELASGSGAEGIELCSGFSDTNSICYGLPANSGAAVNSAGFFEDLPLFGQANTLQGTQITQVVGSSAVPEPATASLLIFPVLLFIWRANQLREDRSAGHSSLFRGAAE